MGNESSQTKAEQPHAHFDAPHEIVIDPALSKEEKRHALDHLEQDARQLAIASAEGMSGEEEANLQDVHAAKVSLELSPVAFAYEVVLKDLRSRATHQGSEDAVGHLISHAVAALEALNKVSEAVLGGPARGSFPSRRSAQRNLVGSLLAAM